MPNDDRIACAIAGCLLGGAVGDALGLPAEGLGPDRIRRRWGDGPWRHRLLFGRGMLSDDTEHAFLTGQALLEAGGDPEVFAHALARRLRWWLAALPAGVGLGTLRAIVKLWFFVPPGRSGVPSAGNGALMRAPLVGVVLADAPKRLVETTDRAAALTHRDPRALAAARAAARIAAYAARLDVDRPPDATQVLRILRENAPPGDVQWPRLIDQLQRGLRDGRSTEAHGCRLLDARRPDRGVSGYAPHSLVAAMHAWLSARGDFRATIENILRAGGDVDSTAALAGAIAGAARGPEAIPPEWLEPIMDRPLSVSVLRRLAARLAELAAGRSGAAPVRWAWPLAPLRNLAFLTIVLAHGFRRLAPPY